MKKMKGVVSMEPHLKTMYEDPKARFKHQSLLQDYDELQMETEAMKKKLLTMKQRKLTLSADVRFLRRRYEYLMKNDSLIHQPKQDLVQPPKLVIRRTNIKGMNCARKKGNLQSPALNLSLKQRIRPGSETTQHKPTAIFDLNQKARTMSGKKPTLQNTTTLSDLNQKGKIYTGKEEEKRNVTPFFDLNKVSKEEEELQTDCCEPLTIEESMRSLFPSRNDEQFNDIKMPVCRDFGHATSRAGKRKISWQDQVALRV